MPPHDLEILVNEFAIRSFRDTADRDYVHARLAYRARLVPQFLWSSLHSLEKYVKCILILNRLNGTKIGHEVTKGLQRINEYGKFEIPISETAEKFIKRLENGSAYRYFEFSYENRAYDILRLDYAVWEIRRYCQVLDYNVEINGIFKNQLEVNLQRIRTAKKEDRKGSCINNGWIENVIDTKAHHSREPLLWRNLYFGQSKRRKARLHYFIEAGNSPLSLHPELLNEVTKYVHIPKAVKLSYEEYINSGENWDKSTGDA